MRLVERRQRARRGSEEGDAAVAIAHLGQRLEQRRDGLVVCVQEAPLREQGVYERVPDRAFDGPAELGARHQEGVDVHAVRIERDAVGLDLPVVDGDEGEVDIGSSPDEVVREAAAEDRREDRLVLANLLDERVERGGEGCANRVGIHQG